MVRTINRSRVFYAVATFAVLLFAVVSPTGTFLGAYSNAYGSTDSNHMMDTMSGSTMTATAETNNTMARTVALKGQISSIQFGSDGQPEWVESGFWVLKMNHGQTSEQPMVSLVARIAMVMPDGNAMHQHSITNFTATDMGMEGNSTHMIRGTATITMRDGPVSDVPMTIRIYGNSVIAFLIGPDRIDGHFGTNPVYGTLAEVSRNAMGSMMGPEDHMMHGETPVNATSLQLEGLTRSTVNYHGNASGYLVYPENATNLPAVVMIHEWWGLNQSIKNMAEELANEGYVVLAADLYGEVATEPNRARELSTSVRNNPEGAVENLQAAVAHLSSLSSVDSSRIASLGWCFGGGFSLQLALNAEQPLAATVVYYGTLVTDEQELSKIDWPVLGIFGSEDQAVPVESARQFDAALDSLGIINEIYIYEGVGHAFANPSGDNYAAEEGADAWEKTLTFLAKYVKG